MDNIVCVSFLFSDSGYTTDNLFSLSLRMPDSL